MQLKLSFSLSFDDLYKLDGLKKIDLEFKKYLQQKSSELFTIYRYLTSEENDYSDKDKANFLISLAPLLENFIAKLFNIEKEVAGLQQIHYKFTLITKIKRDFVQRRALKIYPDPSQFNGDKLLMLLEDLMDEKFTELAFATHVSQWLLEDDQQKLDIAAKYASFASQTIQ